MRTSPAQTSSLARLLGIGSNEGEQPAARRHEK
jgi:hypothetical protein